MSKTEAQFRIERDAETLVQAEVIKADSKRFQAAATHQAKLNKAGERVANKK